MEKGNLCKNQKCKTKDKRVSLGIKYNNSVIYLQNYSKKPVMEKALPVAVKFLLQGNRELSKNMSSYLSLAVIENSRLLAHNTQPILDSILLHGEIAKSLSRGSYNAEYIISGKGEHDHGMSFGGGKLCR